MSSRRLFRFASVVVAAMLVASCERLDVGPQLAGELGRARDDARRVLAIAADSAASQRADSTEMAALLYLERHRLGLGSPFRLIEQALSDPRMDDSSRRRVAWMLLARTLDGDGHQVDAAALELVSTARGTGAQAGVRHRALIDGAVGDARDPRAGEVAVRVAYAVVTTEGTLSEWSPAIAARAAAIARDREIARDDARTLLRAARAQGSDPLALVPLWRNVRRFHVERPPMEPLSADAEREALELVPRLIGSIRVITDGLVAVVPDSTEDPVDEELPRDHLSGPAARRLVELTERLNLPPQTPVVVSLSSHRSRLLDRRELDPPARRARAGFAARALNEETFAAEYAMLRQMPAAAGGAAAVTALATAVSLRTYAQEEVWWPGMPAPAARDVRDRFALASVTFDEDVPAEWKGYYTRMIAFALTDLQRVMPALRVRGLGIHVGESPMRSEALAMHDPRQRIIYLPLGTSAGTLAHEVAHDIDWQVARARYGTRGEYASDRAIRNRDGSSLAQSLQGLTSATLIPPLRQNNHRPPHDSRPAEVFARSVDWFVAVSLAREGRSNGYLSSVQDDVLTGYVTVAPPDVTGEAGEALVRILDDVAPVSAASREWFLTHYGAGRSPAPVDLTRKVLEHPVAAAEPTAEGLGRQLASVVTAREKALESVNAAVCRSRNEFDDRRLAAARSRVIMMAAEARARGFIREHFEQRLRVEGDRWAAQQALLGALPLSSFDPFPSELVRSMLEQARLLEEVQTAPLLRQRGRDGCPLPTPARGPRSAA